MTALVSELRAGSRRALARAITLIESSRADHAEQAQNLLAELLPFTGNSTRVGLSGPPGVGKSTFTEALGLFLVEAGHKVAVLAVDPSSNRTGGSIMGDKTRMPRLSVHPHAFIRPSPAGGTLGGVARRTRETLLLCEAAGYDVLLVETVGVGQSEVAVADMTDLFVLLTLPNAGDGLQGVKRGVMERLDLAVVNKADADPAGANRAQAELRGALHLLTSRGATWQPRVLQASALTGAGVPEVWQSVLDYREALGEKLADKRREQQLAWFEELLRERVWSAFVSNVQLEQLLAVRRAVVGGTLTPAQGVQKILVEQVLQTSPSSPN